ncbi:unnamed protein product [Euphydryas editha]|uniref:Uncharacterized protein n=1 Tax=Euphydryas editha TaxID=104508 RepID=A0AAU9UVE4_EUPED|nr:unnamed protein product [Euphydryas editha]
MISTDSAPVLLTLQSPEDKANNYEYEFSAMEKYGTNEVFQRELGDSIKAVTQALCEHTPSEEMVKLQAENACLEKQMAFLRAEVAELKEIAVQRDLPTKYARILITGLDNFVTPEMVAAAVAKAGQIDASIVKTGEVSVGPGGMGVVVARCPIAAVKTIADGGRILIG